MAAKKAGAKGPKIPTTKAQPAGSRRKSITTLKGSPEWAEWLEGAARHYRTTVIGLIDRALAEWAEANGYPIQPPPR